MKQEDQRIEVIETFNEKPKSYGVRHDLAVSCFSIFILTIVIFKIILGINWTLSGSIGVWFCAGWVFVAKDDAHDFISKFIPLPGAAYFIEPTLFVPATDKGVFKRKMKHLPKNKVITVNGKKEKLVPFHKESDLHALMELSFGYDKFAVYLKCDKKGRWSATIPLLMKGLHTEMLDEDATNYALQLSQVLKDIPDGEDLTLMLGCRSKSHRRQEQLQKLRSKNNLPLIDLILSSDGYRIKETTAKGSRQEWSHYTYLSWEQQQNTGAKDDELAKVVSILGNFVQSKIASFTGTQNSRDYAIYSQIAKDIYEESYSSWKSILENKGKLEFSTLSAKEAWEHLYYKFNDESCDEAPQVIEVAKAGGEYICNIETADCLNPKDAFSVLFAGNHGNPNCPQHHQRRDSVRVNGELVATMVLKCPTAYWKDPREQLLSIWSKISEENVRDTEIYLQISNASKKKISKEQKTITKQATYEKAKAIATGKGIDVDATFRQDKAIEAQARLHLGGSTLYTAMIILVYRQTHEELKKACTKMSDIFSPAKLVREKEVCLQTWLETQIFNNRKMLVTADPYTEQRYVLDSMSARGVLPIAKPSTLHDRGVELINDEGGFPIHLNLFKNNERAIILGKSGSGKSLLGAAFITYALAEGVKVIAVDMSNDGNSTFKSYVEQLGDEGSYINLTDDKHFNILQPPDLSLFSTNIIKKRLGLWKESLRVVLVAMIVGQSDSNSEIFRRVDSIVVTLLKTFFEDQNISERYNEAFEHGWKSEAWQRMPVLKDLQFFCSRDKLGLEYSKADEEAIALIVNQIESKLNDSSIGEAIGNVSNVPPTPMMTMFALSGLNNDNNSYIMSLVAQMACLNVSLESPLSLAVLDEATELIKKPGFARVIAHRFTRGRKEGQSIILIGQDINAIALSEVKGEIVKNTDYWLIGNIQNSNSPKDYVDILGLPLQVVSRNRSSSFKPSKRTMSSSFLLRKSKKKYWHTVYFPSAMTLAVTVNSQQERAARERILQRYSETTDDITEGLAAFGREIYQAYSRGKSIEGVGYDEVKKIEAKHNRDRDYAGVGGRN